ncbi:MAG: C45 family autoproteolytic acyltransferase/hydrolase [Pseudomonadota bacterium]
MLETSRIHLLQLSGSNQEMGRAHGSALKKAGTARALDYYSEFLTNVLSFQPLHSWDRSLRRAFRWIVGETVEQAFVESVPSRYREQAVGFSEGCGVPTERILRARVMPDVYSYLLAQRFRLFRPHGIDFLNFGCTSFAWAGSKEAEIPILHARTLDYPGGEAWTDAPAVLEYAPPDSQRYVSVSSLGVDTAGITSMNEEGLTLSLHMNYSTRVSSRGAPVLVIGDEIMRRARSLGQAVDIAKSFRRGAAWSFLISSLREKNAVVLESDADSLSVRSMKDGKLVATNHFLDPALARHEYWITPGRRMDSRARYERMSKLLAGEGSPTIGKAVRFLRDSYDPVLNAERAFGSTISQVHTVSAVVFDPAHRTVFVAHGRPPAAKTEFKAFTCFPGPFETDAKLPAEPPGPTEDGRRSYALAHDAYFPSGNLEKAETYLRAGVGLIPGDALLRFMLGLVALKRERFGDARASLEKAMTLHETAYRKAQNRLYLARTLDLCGERGQALDLYRSLFEDSWFKREARRGAKKPWSLRENRKLVLDFTIGDAVEA